MYSCSLPSCVLGLPFFVSTAVVWLHCGGTCGNCKDPLLDHAWLDTFYSWNGSSPDPIVHSEWMQMEPYLLNVFSLPAYRNTTGLAEPLCVSELVSLFQSVHWAIRTSLPDQAPSQRESSVSSMSTLWPVIHSDWTPRDRQGNYIGIGRVFTSSLLVSTPQLVFRFSEWAAPETHSLGVSNLVTKLAMRHFNDLECRCSGGGLAVQPLGSQNSWSTLGFEFVSFFVFWLWTVGWGWAALSGSAWPKLRCLAFQWGRILLSRASHPHLLSVEASWNIWLWHQGAYRECMKSGMSLEAVTPGGNFCLSKSYEDIWGK